MIKCDIVIHKEFIYDDAGQFCEAKIAPQDSFDIQTYGAGCRRRHSRQIAVRSGTHAFGAGWSSSVARWAHNPKVAGSNPAPATNIKRLGGFIHPAFFILTEAGCSRTGPQSPGGVVPAYWMQGQIQPGSTLAFYTQVRSRDGSKITVYAHDPAPATIRKRRSHRQLMPVAFLFLDTPK